MLTLADDRPTRVLLAVIRIGPGCSISEICALTKIPRVTVHAELVWLKSRKLVDWDPMKKRTLRPLVGVVKLC